MRLEKHRWVWSILPVGVFLTTWQVAASAGLINPALFSSPVQIIETLVALAQRGSPEYSALLMHLGATLARLLVASAIGAVVGTLSGLLMGVSIPLYRFFDPLITVLMPIPGIAMAPLFIVWLGFGDSTIITLGALAMFFPLAYNTVAGVRSIDKQLIRAAQMVGLRGAALLQAVYLPWAMGYVLLGLKLGLARCWRTIIAVEFIAAANWGLGYMIWDGAEYLRASVVYSGIVLLIVAYLVLDTLVVRTLERLTITRWGMVRS